MGKSRVLLVVAIALTVSVVFTGSAFASVTVLTEPDVFYLGMTKKISIAYLMDHPGAAVEEPTPSIADEELTVTFNPPMSIRAYQEDMLEVFTLPSLAEWGEAQLIEGPPNIYPDRIGTYGVREGGSPGITMTLSRPATVLGFEVATRNTSPQNDIILTMTLKRDGQVVGTTSKYLPAQYYAPTLEQFYQNARLVGLSNSVPFDEVELTSTGVSPYEDNNGLFFAQFRYALAGQSSTPIPTGSSIQVTAGQVTVTFPSVTVAGALNVTPYAPRHEGPTNFRLLPDLYFDINPTATFVGPATVTLQVPTSYTGDLTKLKVFHWKEPGGWETITPTVDVGARTLTFQTEGFSDFGVGEPISQTPVVSTPASSWWSIVATALLASGILVPVARRSRVRHGTHST